MFGNKNSVFPDSKEHFASWKKISIPGCSERVFHASVVYNDLMVVIGGDSGKDKDILDEPLVVDLTKQMLVTAYLKSKVIEREGHTMCLNDNGSIIAYGGYSDKKSVEYMEIENLSQNEVVIKSKRPHVSGQSDYENPLLTYHTANVYRNNIYVFGGLNQTQEATNKLWELDLENTSWAQCKSRGQVPEKRYLHSSALHGNNLYIFGGRTKTGYFGEQGLNDLYILDLEKNFEWRLVSTHGTPPSRRFGASMQEYRGRLYLFGGFNNIRDVGFLNDVFTFCTKTNVWTQLQLGLGPSPRYGQTSFIWNNHFYIFGGDGPNDATMSDMWCFNLDDKEKSEIENSKIGVDSQAQKGLKIENDPFCLIDLFVGKAFTDIVLEVEGKEFPCHKAIISQRCKFFANLFNSGMSDSNSTKLRITDVKADSFEAMLKFIYGDPNLTIDEGLAFELLGLSDKYLLPNLKEQCEIVLTKLLTLENFINIAKAAEMVESDVIKTAVFKFARQNITTLKDRGDLSKLSQSLLIEFFASLVTK